MKFGMRSMFKPGDVPFIGSDEDPFEEWYNESIGYAIRSEMMIAEVAPANMDSVEAFKYYLRSAYKAGQQQMVQQVHHLMKHTVMD